MIDDDFAAIGWLQGKNKAPTADAHDARGQPVVQVLGVAAGHAALIRLLRSGSTLNLDVQNALANALEPNGSSNFKLTLSARRGRGRPPKPVKTIVELHKLGLEIEARVADGAKPYVAVAEAADARGKARSSGFAAQRQRRKEVQK